MADQYKPIGPNPLLKQNSNRTPYFPQHVVNANRSQSQKAKMSAGNLDRSFQA